MLIQESQFWRDVVFGTIFIFFIMFLLSTTLSNIELLDPIGEALSDMEITDMVFSSDIRETPPVDENIIFVNIGMLPRREIGQMMGIINKYEPKAIGMDAIFRTLKPDTLGDYILADALANTHNVVMYAKLIDPDDNGVWGGVETSHPLFTQNNIIAHVNLTVEEAGIEQFQFKTCRSFFPNEKVIDPDNGEMSNMPAFAVKLSEMYDAERTQEFLARNKEEELINYRGNIIDFGRSKHGTRYFALDWDQVLNEQFTADLIKDKIVLFGFLGATLDDTRSFEDKYFTPLNVKYAGRANPDMYGVVVHANIISMILNNDQIDQMSEFSAWTFAVIICLLNVILFQIIYRRLPRWYDGITKLVQLLEAFVFMAIIVFGFHIFSIKLNLTYGIFAIVLAGDSLEVYNGVLKNLFSSERRRQLFTIKKD